MKIKKILADPERGLWSANKMKAKYGDSIKMRKINKAVEKEEAYQLHKETKRHYHEIISPKPLNNFQIDLADMRKYSKISGNQSIIDEVGQAPKNLNRDDERVIRTIRNMLKKYWSLVGNYNFVNVMDKLVKNYNTTPHGKFKNIHTPWELMNRKGYNLFRREDS